MINMINKKCDAFLRNAPRVGGTSSESPILVTARVGNGRNGLTGIPAADIYSGW
jgi:hypothetical protein